MRPKVQAYRLERVQRLIDEIMSSPGARRKELARRYFVSERQMQSDLALIHYFFGLPLVGHRDGYRFEVRV